MQGLEHKLTCFLINICLSRADQQRANPTPANQPSAQFLFFPPLKLKLDRRPRNAVYLQNVPHRAFQQYNIILSTGYFKIRATSISHKNTKFNIAPCFHFAPRTQQYQPSSCNIILSPPSYVIMSNLD